MQRKLKVSRETIRRNLVLLAERNALRKTHGGALAVLPLQLLDANEWTAER